jgi:hypothetical protein
MPRSGHRGGQWCRTNRRIGVSAWWVGWPSPLLPDRVTPGAADTAVLQGPLREVLQPAGEFRTLGGQLHHLSQQPVSTCVSARSPAVPGVSRGCGRVPGGARPRVTPRHHAHAQSVTTVCNTVSASPSTRAVIGSPPGTSSAQRRRRRAAHEPGSQNPARYSSSTNSGVCRGAEVCLKAWPIGHRLS